MKFLRSDNCFTEILASWGNILHQIMSLILNWFLVEKSFELYGGHGMWWKRLLNIIDMLQEYQRRWGWGVRVVGSLRFNVQGRGGGEVLPNLDPFGQVEKGGSVCKNWTIFIDATNVSSLHPYNSFDLSI